MDAMCLWIRTQASRRSWPSRTQPSRNFHYIRRFDCGRDRSSLLRFCQIRQRCGLQVGSTPVQPALTLLWSHGSCRWLGLHGARCHPVHRVTPRLIPVCVTQCRVAAELLQ